MKTALEVQEREGMWMLGVILLCVVCVLALHGCGGKGKASTTGGPSTLQKIESGIQTFISDVKTIDKAAVKVAPAVTAIAETLSPGSAVTVALERGSTVLTKSNGAIQSFSLTFPPQQNGTLQTIQASAAMVAQLAPHVQAIADATAPGSSATKAIDKASIQIGTVNGIIQHLVITVPDSAPPADVVPPAPAGN